MTDAMPDQSTENESDEACPTSDVEPPKQAWSVIRQWRHKACPFVRQLVYHIEMELLINRRLRGVIRAIDLPVEFAHRAHPGPARIHERLKGAVWIHRILTLHNQSVDASDLAASCTL